MTQAHGGLVNKFAGDAALCVFGAPLAREDPAGSALAAGREMCEAARLTLDAAIGVSAGTVVAGNVGTADRYEYTVIGDPVNEASRLTELAKEHNGRLLASEAAVQRASAAEAERWKLTDEVQLRGRSEKDAPGGADMTQASSGIASDLAPTAALERETTRSGSSTRRFAPIRAPSAWCGREGARRGGRSRRKRAPGSTPRSSGSPSRSRTTWTWRGRPRRSAAPGSGPPDDGRRRGRPAAAGRGRRHRRQDHVARARPVAVHRGPGFGITRNPWHTRPHPRRLVGRSAAAAVAAGWCRSPSAPTAPAPSASPPPGRTSSASSPSAAASPPGRTRRRSTGLTCIGPLARTVADAALLLDVATGNVDGDLHRPPPPAEPYAEAAHRDPGHLRIALSLRGPVQRRALQAQPRGARAGRAPVATFSPTSATRSSRPSRPTAHRPAVHAALDERHPGLGAARPRPSVLDPRTRHNATVGRLLGGPLLKLARAAEPLLQRRVGAIFKDVDVVLAPDDRPAAAADRRGRGPRRLGHGQGRRRRRPVRVAVERARLARHQRSGRAHGRRTAGRRRSCSVRRNSEPLLISLAAQLETVERWFENTPQRRRLNHPTGAWGESEVGGAGRRDDDLRRGAGDG